MEGTIIRRKRVLASGNYCASMTALTENKNGLVVGEEKSSEKGLLEVRREAEQRERAQRQVHAISLFMWTHGLQQ